MTPMKHDTHELQLTITNDDAGLLIVALWKRTREAANRGDYEELRDRLLLQLRAQGVDADPMVEVETDDGGEDLTRSPVCGKCSGELDDTGECPESCPQPWHQVEQHAT